MSRSTFTKMIVLTGLLFAFLVLDRRPAGADAPVPIEWKDLLSEDAVEDPLKKLSREQLPNLAHVARNRTFVAAEKLDTKGDVVKEATEIERRLTRSGVDFAWFLAQREQVGRLRRVQGAPVRSTVRSTVLGKVVQLDGFVVPLKSSGSGKLVTEFLLLPNSDACHNSAIPLSNQVVHVHYAEGIRCAGPVTAARLTGTISVEQTKHGIQRPDGPAVITSLYAIVPQKAEVVVRGRVDTQTPTGNGKSSVSRAEIPKSTSVIERIAFGSCAKHWQPQPIWESVIAKQPDLFLFLGDAIYADTDGVTAWDVTEGQLRGEWNRLADKPEFQAFRAQVPIMATWDNHDYGSHAGGVEFPLKQASRDAFLDFFGEPAGTPRRSREGVYDAKMFGPEGRRVQVIMLDTRYHKSPPTRSTLSKSEAAKRKVVGTYVPNADPDVTLLGAAQWAWLERQLKQPADIRFICSSTQVIPDEKGMDEWGNYPRERQRLFGLLSSTGASGVILLSGNVHFAEISQISESVAYPLTEFTSSGLTHIDPYYPTCSNSLRIAGPLAEIQFGLVELDWDQGKVTLTACDLQGKRVFAREILVSQLRPESDPAR